MGRPMSQLRASWLGVHFSVVLEHMLAAAPGVAAVS
jgi:hypothetical protein